MKIEESFSTFNGVVKVNFNLDEEKPCLIIGENGIGKSSFFHYMKHLNLKNSSRYFKGQSVGFLDQKPLRTLGSGKVRSLFHFLKQEYPQRFIYKNLKDYPLISLFNYEDKLDSSINDLSGGENQILKILTLFSLKTDLFFLDEPTQHLDHFNREKFYQILGDKDFLKGKRILVIDHLKNIPSHILFHKIHFTLLDDGIYYLGKREN